MTAALTLYYAPRTRSMTALYMLEELGQEYALESFEIYTGRHKQPDFLALNPMGKVPVVVHDGVPISEIGAIAIYLGDRFPQADLAPAIDDPSRAEYLRWIFFASAIMEPAYVAKFTNLEISAGTVAWGSFEQMRAVLEGALERDRAWLLGDRFTMADVVVGMLLFNGQKFGFMPKEGRLGEYTERLTARAAFTRAVEIEARESARFPAPTT